MDGYTLFDYWLVVYRRKWWIVAITLLSAAFAIALSLVIPSVYEAKCLFFVPSKPNVLSYFSEADARQNTRSALVPEAKGETQKIYLGLLNSDTLRQAISTRFPGKSVASLKRSIDFKSNREFMLEVYARDRDGAVAADIANAYTELFDKTLNDYSLQAQVVNRASMEDQLTRSTAALDTAQAALLNFQIEHKVRAIDEEIETLIRQRRDYTKELSDASLRVVEIEQQLGSLKKQYDKEAAVFHQSYVALSSPVAQDIQRQLSDLESKSAADHVYFKDSHESMAKLSAQIVQKRQDLAKEIQRISESQIQAPTSLLENLRQDIVHRSIEREFVTARKSGLTSTMDDINRQLDSIPDLKARYEKLRRTVDKNQRLVDALQSGLAEVSAQEQRDIRNVVVVDPARAPDDPVFPNIILNVLAALGLGLIGGIACAFLLDFLERVNLHLREDLAELEKELA